jgi:hypothetical protein
MYLRIRTACYWIFRNSRSPMPAAAQRLEAPVAPAGSHFEIHQIPRVISLQSAAVFVIPRRKAAEISSGRGTVEFKIQNAPMISLYLKS